MPRLSKPPACRSRTHTSSPPDSSYDARENEQCGRSSSRPQADWGKRGLLEREDVRRFRVDAALEHVAVGALDRL